MFPTRLSGKPRPNFQAYLSFTCLSVALAMLMCVGVILGPGWDLWRLGVLEWHTLSVMILLLLAAVPLGLTAGVLAVRRRYVVTGEAIRLTSHLACCIKVVSGFLCLWVAADAYPDVFGDAFGSTPAATFAVVAMLMLWSAYRFYALYRQAEQYV